MLWDRFRSKRPAALTEVAAAAAPFAGQHTAAEGDELSRRVTALLAEFRPFMLADGGDIELVAVRNGVVRVRLKGACAGCPSSAFTLQLGLERYLRERLPQVLAVEEA